MIVPGGMIAVDNAISHQEELVDFMDVVAKTDGCESILLPFDSGLLLIKF
ncbi:MAG: hypothetical protein Q8898_15960 [Bacillota bacterium]|nr:hypothetical protein [Bacillota bacterium]